MHEMSIAKSILDIVRQYVPEERLTDVKSIRVRIGQMAGVVPDSLDFSFEAIVDGTPMARARLDIEETPLRLRCSACEGTFAADAPAFLCPACGSGDITVVSGTELQVVEIELSNGRSGAS